MAIEPKARIDVVADQVAGHADHWLQKQKIRIDPASDRALMGLRRFGDRKGDDAAALDALAQS